METNEDLAFMESLGELLKANSASSDGTLTNYLAASSADQLCARGGENVGGQAAASNSEMFLSSDENDWINFAQDMFLNGSTDHESIPNYNGNKSTNVSSTNSQSHMDTSTSSSNFYFPDLNTGQSSALSPKPADPLPPRCHEETFCYILSRTRSTSGSVNTKYQCKYCRIVFIGSQKKIRCHLSGQNNGGTRVAKCAHVPEEVREMMSSLLTKQGRTASKSQFACDNEAYTQGNEGLEGAMHSDSDPEFKGLPARNAEEAHTIVLARCESKLAKSSNSRYKCLYCKLRFVGGPQKIRAHLLGGLLERPAGAPRVAKCTRVPMGVLSELTNNSLNKPGDAVEGVSGEDNGSIASRQSDLAAAKRKKSDFSKKGEEKAWSGSAASSSHSSSSDMTMLRSSSQTTTPPSTYASLNTQSLHLTNPLHSSPAYDHRQMQPLLPAAGGFYMPYTYPGYPHGSFPASMAPVQNNAGARRGPSGNSGEDVGRKK